MNASRISRDGIDSIKANIGLVILALLTSKFWSSISAYTKNQLVCWFDDKELSSEADAIN